jgi:hypothetical protein
MRSQEERGGRWMSDIRIHNGARGNITIFAISILGVLWKQPRIVAFLGHKISDSRLEVRITSCTCSLNGRQFSIKDHFKLSLTNSISVGKVTITL